MLKWARFAIWLATACAARLGEPTSMAIAPGVSMPLVSLGTGGGMQANETEEAVYVWLTQASGKGVDSARIYDNEAETGHALARVKDKLVRSDYFITTKLPGPLGFNGTVESIERSLRLLGLDYVDLFLIHFPGDANATALRQESWKGMEAVLAKGQTRAIGVSNFNISHIEDVLDVARVPPAVNQIMFNPASHDDELRKWCQSKGIHVQAWSPLGGHNSRHGEVLKLPEMKRIAATHGVSTAQVSLRWVLQQGLLLATGTTKLAHMKTDLDIFHFELTPEEMDTISNIQNQPTNDTSSVS